MNFRKKPLLLLAAAILIIAVFAVLGLTKEPTTENQSKLASSTFPSANFDSVATSSLKTYRNEEFGFEFQYPDGWTFHENTFKSPFSKFNLVGASPREKGIPNPIFSPLLVNIVTPNFVEMQFSDLEKTASRVAVFGIEGKKYEYTEDVTFIDIIFPYKTFAVILGAQKEYEDVFNIMVSSFRLLQ